MGQRRRGHTPEQIIRKLREADRLLGEGQDAAEDVPIAVDFRDGGPGVIG